ncbi:MAG: hypothetical protein PHP93_05535 [Kiritimatiellales bacterium]|nr:hypothetical protein [Kiritimatiellales bacterium]
MNNSFKTCPNCKTVWETLNVFLNDPFIEFAGYQVNFEDLKGGLFYFSHTTTECGTTLALPVGKFTALSDRPMLASKGRQPDGCPNLCVRQKSLDPCPVECECIWVREIIQTLHER